MKVAHWLKGLSFAGITFFTLMGAGQALADLDDFKGVWFNSDNSTRGITKIAVRGRGENIRLQAWGQCHPQDCDWGAVQAEAFATSVSDDLDQQAIAIKGVFSQGFKTTTVILKQARRGERLIVETYSEFQDRSNRTNYTTTDRFIQRGGHGGGNGGGHGGGHGGGNGGGQRFCSDLIVESIARPQWDGHRRRSIMRAVIKNVGNINSPASQAKFQDLGNHALSFDNVPALAPGGTASVVFTTTYWVFDPDARFSITADSSSVIQECNEGNNVKIFDEIG